MNKKAEIPKAKALKLLCLLSFIGFIYCMALDSAKFITYQFYSPDNLIEDSNLHNKIKKNGFEFISKKYDWEIIVKELEKNIYK